MSSVIENLTQKDRLAIELKKIKSDVTAGDRLAYKEETNCSLATVSYYLNGHVSDIDTGVKILNFFRHRIAEREKVIS